MRSDESDFQRALLLALGSRPDLRLWRQNVGVIPVRNELGDLERVFRAGPPKGAADLSGIIRPEGWRLEIEVKGARGRVSAEQARWAVFLRAWGGVSLLATYDDAAPMGDNVRRVVRQLDAAIAERRMRAARA
jgi:hypothetical protein